VTIGSWGGGVEKTGRGGGGEIPRLSKKGRRWLVRRQVKDVLGATAGLSEKEKTLRGVEGGPLFSFFTSEAKPEKRGKRIAERRRRAPGQDS